MPTPYTSSTVSSTVNSNTLNIDALLSGYKWGGVTGSQASVSFSFPWVNGASANFSGPNGTAYSSNGEASATYHFGLNSVQQNAAINALQAWASVANITFNQVADTSTNVGDIRFAFTSASSITSHWGYANYPNSYYPRAGDVWINSKYASDIDWSVGSYNYEAIMHEIGHAIGLKHPGDYNGGGGAPPPYLPSTLDNRTTTIMSYNNVNNLFEKVIVNQDGRKSLDYIYVNPSTPMVLDIQAIQYIYGANTTYHTGDDIYTFDPKTPFLKTIWDAGGNDTISVYNFSTNCIIDLRSGHYSTIVILSDNTSGINWVNLPLTPTYDNEPNLGIAYGCIIENAIGGFGDDTIYGNQANNIVDGGNGVDTFIESGNRANFSLIQIDNKIILTNKTGSEGTDQITNIENLKFDDLSLNLQSNLSSNLTQAKFFSIAYSPSNIRIDDHASIKISNSYSSISTIKFSDMTLDTSMFTKTAALSHGSIVNLVELYIASFNRAPDSVGLDYWGSRYYDGLNNIPNGMSLEQIAKSFFTQKETIAAYPSGMATKDFVTTVYNNVLSRGPDTGGLNYWVGQLDKGIVSKDSFLLAIINGAMAATGSAVDRQTLANKEAVGEHYAIFQGLNNSTNWAKDVMSAVTDQMATVTAANAKTDAYAAIAANPATSDLVVKLVGVAV